MTPITSLNELERIAESLVVLHGAQRETRTRQREIARADEAISAIVAEIRSGADPLGDAFSSIKSNVERRGLGQVYTPTPIVDSMIRWAAKQGKTPVRVVDPGCGSGRFLLAAGRQWPHAKLVGIDIDRVAVSLARGNLAAAGFAERAEVVEGDYRDLKLPQQEGATIYIGNPPYVRHHGIDARYKKWLVDTARGRDLSASQLAGLHVHFFLATAVHGQRGDFGTFITSAEWLDVNYGRLVRELLIGELGGSAVTVIEPEAMPFSDAATTAAIACFAHAEEPASVRFRRVAKVEDLGDLSEGQDVSRRKVKEADRWSTLTRASKTLPDGYVQLGDICRVHRGTATGANNTWVVRSEETDLPQQVLLSAVTRARELIAAEDRLAGKDSLKCIINLPKDLDEIEDKKARRLIEAFIKRAAAEGIDKGYLASKRKPWWHVGVRDPAPVLATYMARRSPAFVHNDAQAHHLNIAHGLYPRELFKPGVLEELVKHLRTETSTEHGRTYAGGLTKFEPKEMERLIVPAPATLEVYASDPQVVAG